MSDFKSGYGQAKADTLRGISEAMKLLDREMKSWQHGFKPTPEQKKELEHKQSALRWVRAIVKAQKSPR